MRRAFYRLQDGLFHPLQPATGSWNKSHQNGTAFIGLVVRSLEALPQPVPMLLARITVDILRPVPFQPVAPAARIVREGRNMQALEAEIVADGEVCVRASGLRVRLAENPGEPELPLDIVPPDQAPDLPVTSVLGAGWPMETRMVKGRPKQPGPGACWVRYNADLVEGEPTSAVVRAAMSADMGSGPSSVMDKNAWTYANVDLSMYLTREPRGDWTLIDCETVSAGNGSALVNTVIADQDGPVGRAHQTLFVLPRTPA